MKRLELEKQLNKMDLDLGFFYHEEKNQLDILIDGDEDVLFNFLRENCNIISLDRNYFSIEDCNILVEEIALDD